MAAAFGLLCCPCTLVPESELSHIVHTHHSLIPKLSHHEWKNLGFSSLKKSTMRSCFVVSVANGVFPLMMFLVVKQQVMMAGLARELAHRHRAVTST